MTKAKKKLKKMIDKANQMGGIAFPPFLDFLAKIRNRGVRTHRHAQAAKKNNKKTHCVLVL